MTQRDIEAVNRKAELALLDSGRLIPITTWFDDEGERCGPDEAVVAVAGEDGVGWFTFRLDSFAPAPCH